GFAASSLLSLYRPLVYIGGNIWHQPLTPWGVSVVLSAIYGAGCVGGLMALVRADGAGPHLPGRVVLWWGLALLICAAQPSIRLVLFDVMGIHQGRWLLPMLAPAAAVAGIGLASLARGGAAVAPAVAAG